MFSSFTSFSNPLSIPRFLQHSSGSTIDLTPVDVHVVEINPDKKPRTLKHLLKLNHANYAIVYHNLQFHNHAPHILGSAYLLGACSTHLDDIYDNESKELEPWADSPGEISTFDWRDYLGNPIYQRAYVDFFEDQLVLNGYDWKKVLNLYLFDGKEPLVNNLVAGLGHPLIHLGYAYELDNREIAMEALGMASTSYNFMHKYLDDPAYSKPPFSPSSYSTTSPLEILKRIHEDDRFHNLFDHPGAHNIGFLFKTHESAVLEHWNAWQLPNPKKQFEDSQYAATALLVGSQGEDCGKQYDFFLVHLLTTSHAIRILLPLIPTKFQLPLVRQWWLLTIAVYVAQLRPIIDVERFCNHETGRRGWEWVSKEAIESKWALDAHFVKALRAMKVAAITWGDLKEEGYYLKAAVKMCDEFDGWGGFGSMS
ncbi:MAG: hypothetical protein Q9217_003389 [Psora testacea]